MKILTQSEAKEAMLQIFLFVDRVCKENNIQFTLYGGTLLGAVRHGGYIPWDDDIDIAMTRNNYDKFIEVMNKEKGRYQLFSYFTKPAFKNITFLKIIDTLIKVEYSGIKNSEKEYLWIDVFPIDTVSENKKTRMWINYRIWFCLSLIWCRRTTNPSTLQSLIKYFFIYIKDYWLLSCIDRHKNWNENCNFVNDLTSSRALKNDRLYSKNLFENFTSIMFEGHSFPCVKNHDEYLKITYGDYMQLPPEEKRINHTYKAYLEENLK